MTPLPKRVTRLAEGLSAQPLPAHDRKSMAGGARGFPERESPGFDSEQRLLDRVRRGSESALGVLFARYGSWLRRWARGRLPLWARDGLDTSDLVQDALHGTLARLSTLRSGHAAALRSYLRRAVENRIGDHQRHALSRLNRVGEPSEPPRFSDDGAPQLRQLIDKQTWARYLKGLERLTPRHRRLVVGRVECGYSYRQLALVERLSTPDAARMAFRRALKRLSAVMPGGLGPGGRPGPRSASAP